jgi:biopolymer transport protein ExbB/TolQ
MNSDAGLLNRLFYVAVGTLSAALIVAILTALLDEGNKAAILLMDYNKDPLLPYPFSIQNLMWLLLGAGLGDAFHRRSFASREERLARSKLLPEDERTVLLKDDMVELRQKLGQIRRQSPGFLARLLEECILYFNANESPDQTQSMMSTMVDLELHRADLRYTLLRYLVWVIPTLGFIGTVVGIAAALGHLSPSGGEVVNTGEALGPVISSLGVAFNTTIVALIFSAVLVLVMQFVQKKEENAINTSSEYCLKNLINRLYVPDKK